MKVAQINTELLSYATPIIEYLLLMFIILHFLLVIKILFQIPFGN